MKMKNYKYFLKTNKNDKHKLTKLNENRKYKNKKIIQMIKYCIVSQFQ